MKSRIPEEFMRKLDMIIERGGSWGHMETRALKLANVYKIKCDNKDILRNHYNYRKKSDYFYFHKLIVDNDGIYNPEERECQCGNRFLRNKKFPLTSMLGSFFEGRHCDIDDLCEDCLYELMEQLEREEVNKLSDEWRSESSQWDSLDRCDY
jgi:hypothetical protein